MRREARAECRAVGQHGAGLLCCTMSRRSGLFPWRTTGKVGARSLWSLYRSMRKLPAGESARTRCCAFTRTASVGRLYEYPEKPISSFSAPTTGPIPMWRKIIPADARDHKWVHVGADDHGARHLLVRPERQRSELEEFTDVIGRTISAQPEQGLGFDNSLGRTYVAGHDPAGEVFVAVWNCPSWLEGVGLGEGATELRCRRHRGFVGPLPQPPPSRGGGVFKDHT